VKKLIIKRFAPGSVFKAVLMAVAIPFLIFFGFFAFLVSLGGAIGDSFGSKFAFAMLVPFLLMPIIYGLIGMLLAASYNWLVPRFGGLEIEAEDAAIEEAAGNTSKLEDILDNRGTHEGEKR
jgi:predicted neutral ceramidase superfamily lipid hydrolase